MYARTAGLLFVVLLVGGVFGMIFVPSSINVPGDAAATASKLASSERLFRAGILSDSIIFLSEIVMVVLLYRLFEPVSRTLALVAAFARLAMTVIQGVNLLVSLSALLLARWRERAAASPGS